MVELHTPQPAMATRTASTPAHLEGARGWIALSIILLAALMATVDDFIVIVSLPQIKDNVHLSAAESQWMVAAYLLAFSVLLLTGGRLGDIYGCKRMFLIGVSGFTLFSALCGLAPNALTLIIFRLAEGAMAALLVPQVFSLIKRLFSASAQKRAFALLGAVIGLSALSGQLIGALLLSADLWGWRSIFLVNVPVGGCCALLACFLLHEVKSVHANTRGDAVGIVLATTTLGCVLFPLIQGNDAGWPAWMLLCVVACVPLGWFFVRYERAYQGIPLLEVKRFRHSGFLRLSGTLLLEHALGSGLFFAMTLSLQDGFHFSPLLAALIFLPMAMAFTIGSLLWAALSRRCGRQVLLVGIAIASLGLTLTAIVVQTAWLFWLPWTLAVTGFGNALIATPLPSFLMEGTAEDSPGSLAGLISTIQQIGAALGIGMTGALFFLVLPTIGYPFAFVLVLLEALLLSSFQVLVLFSKGGSTGENRGAAFLKQQASQ